MHCPSNWAGGEVFCNFSLLLVRKTNCSNLFRSGNGGCFIPSSRALLSVRRFLKAWLFVPIGGIRVKGVNTSSLFAFAQDIRIQSILKGKLVSGVARTFKLFIMRDGDRSY